VSVRWLARSYGLDEDLERSERKREAGRGRIGKVEGPASFSRSRVGLSELSAALSGLFSKNKEKKDTMMTTSTKGKGNLTKSEMKGVRLLRISGGINHALIYFIVL